MKKELTEPNLRIGARFPAGSQPEFLLEGKDETGRKAEFRVAKQDLPLLPDCLRILDVFKCPLRNILWRDGRIVHASPEVCLTMSLLRHYLVHLWKVCSRNLHDKQSSYGLDLREPWSSHHNVHEQHHFELTCLAKAYRRYFQQGRTSFIVFAL